MTFVEYYVLHLYQTMSCVVLLYKHMSIVILLDGALFIGVLIQNKLVPIALNYTNLTAYLVLS